MSRHLSLLISSGILVVSAVGTARAQAPKRPLSPEDWDHWRSIASPAISNDGHWVVYSLVPQVGDGELVIRATHGAAEYRVPRGFVGRPQMIAGARDTTNNAPPAQITADSKFALALTYAPMAEYDHARREKRRPADQPKASLAIVSLVNGQVSSVPRVRSFRIPQHTGAGVGGDWVAYLLEPSDSGAANRAARDSSARARAPQGNAAVPGGQPRTVSDSAPRGGRRPEFGSTLVLKNLATGTERRINDVTTYAFDDSAKWLGYTVSSRDNARDGAYVLSPADGKEIALLTGRGTYRQFAFDRAGAQVAFLSDRDEMTSAHPRYTLYYANLKNASAQPVVTSAAIGEQMGVSENGRVSFTRNGNAILFGVAPAPLDSIPADSLYDKAVFDLWSWKDPRLQPQQKIEAGRDRLRSFETLYNLSTRKFVRLANDSMPTVSVSDDGRVALAASSERYSIERMWGDEGDDVYLVDGTTGNRKLIREKISGSAQLSPDAKYVLFFDNGHWYSYAIATGKTVDMTGLLEGVSFAQETWDTPSTPAAWGVAGFTKGDRSVVIYDRYDLWELDPAGVRPARMVTDSLGRKQHLVLRLALSGRGGRAGRGGRGGADAERGVIDPNEPLLLAAFDDSTKASGFYRDQLGVNRAPEKIVMEDVFFGEPMKAGDADEYVVTKSTFVDFPNLYTGTDLARLTKVSDANPQQKEFKWGTVELVHWLSADGYPLQGMLFKPEDFDPHKKYPMITYYYEQNSDNLHHYVPPGGRNVINYTHYVSNGYLIFVPDIHYETGFPGPSAVKSIVPGVEMLLARGYVDPKGLGIQGHSWGGYQTAYVITQTHLFSAAMAGAPVANMTSAYGGIRWGSGLARAFQYEHTQSRIGCSIWQCTPRYIENSPLFWADRITTPLLMMHNDADDAVPWYQGIEMFVALRRLGKEVYLIDYNNDVHNPTKRANQKDIAMRMQQFFDYHLRGYAEPDWMIHGIPYQMKGQDQLHPAVQAGAAAGQQQK
jgi:dipeptidyl aminopeptidase/acylaminoacyl peptidase